MADIVPTAVRSRWMAGIKGKNTKLELVIRSGLSRAGFRFRLHSKKLPGKPDLVLRKHRAVIFANGCFFHGHECSIFKWPTGNGDKWREKITSNRIRDAKNLEALLQEGWRVLVIWECSIRGKHKIGLAEMLDLTIQWIESKSNFAEILEVLGSDGPNGLD